MGLFSKSIIVEPKNILITRTDKIGDLILSIPAILMVRKMYPEAKISVLVRKYNADIIKNFKFIDRIIISDDGNVNDLIKNLQEDKIDTYIALYSDSLIGWIGLGCGAKNRIGPLSKLTSWIVYRNGIIQKRSKSIKNEAEYNLDLVKILNPELYSQQTIETAKIIYDESNAKKVDKFLEDENINNYIVIHPFSGHSSKNLTFDQYIDLIELLNKKNIKENIVISTSENDLEDAEYIQDYTTNVKIFKADSILDLAALIDKSKLYFGNSTGPTHVAGNLGKKVVCIYPKKPSLSKTRWGLFLNDDNTTYIHPDVKNEDYNKKFFDKIDDDILNNIADTIINKLKD